jgi:hypothetical protein
MSIDPAKYIKLATQPWTGNILTDPTDSLVIADPASGGEVTLTEDDGDLLINGQPIPTTGGGGVTQISELFTGSGLVVSPPTGVGAVTLSYIPPGGIQGISAAGKNITVNTVNGTATISLSSTECVTSLTTNSFELYGGGRGDVTIGSYGNALIPVLSQQFTDNNGQKTTTTVNCTSLAPGVYTFEVWFTAGSPIVQLYKYNCSFILLKRPTGLVTCGGTQNPDPNPIGQDDYCRVYVQDPVSQIVYVETQIQYFVNTYATIGIFRIL